MWMPEITEVIPARTQDTIQALVADASGVAPASRDLTWQAEIDRSNPIEQIRVFVTVRTDVNAATINRDGYLALLKQVIFKRNGVVGRGTVEIVNVPGVDVLAENIQMGAVDRTTWSLCNAAPTARTTYTVCYDINLAHAQVDDPLFSYTLCPVHLDTANPTLKLSFANQAELDTNGTPTLKYCLLSVEVHLVRRDMPPERTAEVIANGGFIESDFKSTDVTFASAAAQKVKIESPGEYASVMLTTYTSSTARGDITGATTPVWQLKQQGKVRREFTLAGLQSMNDKSRVQVGTCPFANLYLLDFLRDQNGAPDNNLGALLNTNLEENNGQETNLYFTGGSSTAALRLTGRRFTSPIGPRRFQFAK
jgi:hypothetical protein